MERVKSSDVLDPTHESKRPFRGVVVGYFRRLGPNAWDDYQFVQSNSSELGQAQGEAVAGSGTAPANVVVIHPQVQLQLESRGIEVRVRSGGRVVRLRWLAEPNEIEGINGDDAARRLRLYFVDTFLLPLEGGMAMGPAAVVARKLGDS